MHAIGSKETFWLRAPVRRYCHSLSAAGGGWPLRWCYDVPENPGVSLQGTSIHLQGCSIVGIIVGWLFWVFTMDYLCATVDSLASALGKNTFGRRKIRDGRHSFCKWDPEVAHRVGHHPRPQWKKWRPFRILRLPNVFLGIRPFSCYALRTGICQNKCVKCQFLDLPSPTLQGYI